MMSKSYKSILVIKHGALGDIIQGLDSFASLRHTYPNAKIALLTTPAFASFFHKCPWFDEVYFDYRAPIWRLDRYLEMRALFRRNWDAVIDLQCSKRTRRYHRFFFTRQTGDWYGRAVGSTFLMPELADVNNRNRMLETVALAGAEYTDATLDWIVAKSSVAIPDYNYCILVPGCSAAKPSKRWPSEKFINFAKLALKSNIVPVLIGTSVDAEAISAVHKAVPGVMNFIGKTNIADLIALSEEAEFIVGNDTGPVFIAARSGSPTVMVMGPDTDPLMSAPFGQKVSFVKNDPISAVSVEAVFKEIESL